MIFTVLVTSLLLNFIISVNLSLLIYKYLMKKPLGLQSVLDLIILDMIRVNLFNGIFFYGGFVVPGSLYGKFDYFTSQVIVFMLVNSRVLLFALFLNYLVTKAILIFKGPCWFNGIMDNEVVWLSRLVAIIVTIARFYGDFLVMKRIPGPMTKFLTGTNVIRYTVLMYMHTLQHPHV